MIKSARDRKIRNLVDDDKGCSHSILCKYQLFNEDLIIGARTENSPWGHFLAVESLLMLPTVQAVRFDYLPVDDITNASAISFDVGKIIGGKFLAIFPYLIDVHVNVGRTCLKCCSLYVSCNQNCLLGCDVIRLHYVKKHVNIVVLLLHTYSQVLGHFLENMFYQLTNRYVSLTDVAFCEYEDDSFLIESAKVYMTNDVCRVFSEYVVVKYIQIQNEYIRYYGRVHSSDDPTGAYKLINSDNGSICGVGSDYSGSQELLCILLNALKSRHGEICSST